MWISSMVITISEKTELQANVFAALKVIPCFEIGGDLPSTRVPVVLETEDAGQSKYWFEWLQHLPGVLNVEMAFVGIDSQT